MRVLSDNSILTHKASPVTLFTSDYCAISIIFAPEPSVRGSRSALSASRLCGAELYAYSPVIPDLSIPCMNCLCANAKNRRTGELIIVAPAITTALLRVSSPSERPRFLSISCCWSGSAFAAAMMELIRGGKNCNVGLLI